MENLSLPAPASMQGPIINLTITAVLLFLFPLLCLAVWKKHCGRTVSFAPLLIGAAGFIVSARVLELGVHMVCIVLDNPVSRFLNGNTAAYVLYGIFMAGIFEECGRYVIIKYLMKKNKTRENFVMYGIGHGGIEVWSVTLMVIINLLAVAVMINTQGVEGTLQTIGVTGDAAESTVNLALSLITTTIGFGPAAACLNVLERIFAMSVHIAFTIITAYAVQTGQKKYLTAAVLLHAVFDLFPALFQRGAVTMAVTELWLFFWTVVIALFGARLYRSFPGPDNQDHSAESRF